MGYLLLLHPKIHRLYADARIDGRLAHREGQFLRKKGAAAWRALVEPFGWICLELMLPLKRCCGLCQKPRCPGKNSAGGLSSWRAMVGLPSSLASCSKGHSSMKGSAVRAGQHQMSPTWCPGNGTGSFTAKVSARIGEALAGGGRQRLLRRTAVHCQREQRQHRRPHRDQNRL